MRSGAVAETAGVMAQAGSNEAWKGLGFCLVRDGEVRKGVEGRGLSSVRCHTGWAALQALGLVAETGCGQWSRADQAWGRPTPAG